MDAYLKHRLVLRNGCRRGEERKRVYSQILRIEPFLAPLTDQHVVLLQHSQRLLGLHGQNAGLSYQTAAPAPNHRHLGTVVVGAHQEQAKVLVAWVVDSGQGLAQMVAQHVLHVLQPQIVHGQHVRVGEAQAGQCQVLEQQVIRSFFISPSPGLLFLLLVPVENEFTLDIRPRRSNS